MGKDQSIGSLIRSLREGRGLPLRKVAAYLDIDQAILSKMERGQRMFDRGQIIQLARFFDYDEKKMLITFLSDQIVHEIEGEKYAKEALEVAEQRIEYRISGATDRKHILHRAKEVFIRHPKVMKAWVYGSFARGDDGPGSDIDFAVETNGDFSYFDLADIQYDLELQLSRSVDIGFLDAFRPHILANVEQDLKLIYERQTNK